jgi:quinol monooxygenase YgiN
MYIQIVEANTRRLPEIQELAAKWSAETEGRRTALRTIATRDLDQSDTYLFLVEFPDQEAAKKNSDLPETNEFASTLGTLTEGPTTYRNLEVVDVMDHRPVTRKTIDCRDVPSESNCSLTISGTAEEVIAAATQHAVAAHGHEDNEELRAGLASALKDEEPGR